MAALLLLWLGLQAGMFLVDYIHLATQNKKLNNQIVKIYKDTFPGSHRVIDARAQMQQKLASLKKRKGQQGRGFTEMLFTSSDVLTRFAGLKIKSLRYFDGQINLEVQLTSLQDLDKLKKQLNDEKGYQVNIQNASSEKGFVTARLQISGVAL
jgi:general secretion pathway protein L